MKMMTTKRGLSLAALLCTSVATGALAQDRAIILTDYSSAGEGLRDRLVAAGYDVTLTQNASDLSGSLNGYKQVWDVRISSALAAAESTNYMSYLNNAGGLFLLGENSGFATRNNSIVSFLNAAGAGGVTYGGGITTTQYVTDVFNGAGVVAADSATGFYVPAAGTFGSAGNGTFITTTQASGGGQGTGIAFGPGTLTNAATGRVMTYLDVNTFQSSFYNATPALRALIDRMVGFVGGTVSVTPPSNSSVIDTSQPSFDLDSAAATGSTITFDGGTLSLTGGSDPAKRVTADVTIDDDGAFVDTAGNIGSLTGTVSGTGGLIVTGGGTLGLTGTNTYAGGTVVNGSSTLEISSGNALGSGGLVLMGGTLRPLASTNVTAPITLLTGVNTIAPGANDLGLTGNITGTGGFVKTGTGTLTLAGANSYTGGTTVQAGTLAGDTGSLTGDIANAGTVVFAQGSDGAYAGRVSGTGALVKSGSGTLTLTGANSYTGGTTVQAGTLAGDTGSLTGDIANAGRVVFAQGSDGAYAGRVSGTGALVKSGSGTLTLTGANSYTGGTTVQAGTLAGNTGSLTGDIANAGTVVFAQGSDGAYAGRVSGTGTLVKSGSGTLTLTGANSYTGGTTVQAGTLAGDTGSLTGEIANAGTVMFAQGNDGAYAGRISGTGALVKSGSGSLTLTGTNSYTGGTTVQAGTLAGDTGSLTGDIANAGTVVFAQGSDGAYAGRVSGTGTLVKSGSGTLTLTGTNTYTGGTTVQAGTLAGDTGSLTGDIVNAGTVVFAQGNDGAYVGRVSGTGALVKSGSGTLTLTGANSYTGGTIVQAGTLAGNTTTISGNIANAGNIAFVQGSDGAYAGRISGTGSLVKSGTARLNLTGVNDYTGATLVEAGRLSINGSISNSTAIVGAGGSIGGNGEVGGLIVRTLGTAAPGNSIGMLRTATTVMFERGSFYQVEVDASGAADRLTATGVATLQGGTVQVLAASGTYRPQTRYVILNAAQVSGTFADVTSNMAFLLPTLSYSSNSVTLTLTRNDVSFAAIAATRNQRAAATAINASFAPTSDVYYAIVGQDADTAKVMFDQLSGEVHASALTAATQQADGLRRSVLNRLDMVDEGGPVIWADGIGRWTHLDGDRNAADVTSNTRGGRGGIEFGTGTARLGLAGGYSDTKVHVNARRSGASVKGTEATIYGAASSGNVTLRAGASYHWLDISTRRDAEPVLPQQLSASYHGNMTQGFGELGYRLPAGLGSFEPFVGLNGLKLANDGFTETTGNLALRGAKADRDYAWSTVGLKGRFTLSAQSPVSLGFKAGWQHALTRREIVSTVSFASGGPAFAVAGVPLSRNAGVLDTNLDWAASRTIRLGVRYNGTLANQGAAHEARATLSIGF